VDNEHELQVAKPSIGEGLKREIINCLEQNRSDIVKKAIMPANSITYVEPNFRILDFAYAEFDDFLDFLRSQDF
jgi:hypothetical protein